MIISLPFLTFQSILYPMHPVEYIALANPVMAQELCYEFGLPCENEEAAAKSLLEISSVDNVSLKKVFDIHPDKDLILDLYNEKKSGSFLNASGGQGCNPCRLEKMLYKTNQADGEASYMPSMALPKDFSIPVAMQTNTLLVVGIVSAFVIAMVVYKK
jgi:hypothetical protein